MGFEHLTLDERLAIQAKSKIAVYYSDGVFRGGLLKLAYLNRLHNRVWDGQGTETHRELLWEYPRDSSESVGMWFKILLARRPELDGPIDGSDCFDSASRAIRLRPSEVVNWLRTHGYDPPPELNLEVDRELSSSTPQPEKDQSKSSDLAIEEGDAHLSAAEIAKRFNFNPDDVRKRLERWRHSNADGWIEDSNRRSRAPRYLYKLSAIRKVLDDLNRKSRKSPS